MFKRMGTAKLMQATKPRQQSKTAASTTLAGKLFRQVRFNLTLWYSGVLGIALVLLGLVLYFSTQQSLLQPVENDLAQQAAFLKEGWQHTPDKTCPLVNSQLFESLQVPLPVEVRRGKLPIYLACFDKNGKNLVNSYSFNNVLSESTVFKSNSLAEIALREGKAAAIVDDAKAGTIIYVYALAVEDIDGTGTLGVIQIGRSVDDLQTALVVLRTLLVGLGLLTLIGATLGGLFMANRALRPTRQAFAQQQRFIADASHELRTPLTLLRTNAEVLLRGRDRFDEDDAALLDDIVIEVEHMTELANNLLDLARLDNGQVHLEFDVLDLAELARTTTQRLRHIATTKKVALRQNLTAGVLVIADRPQLEQVILILLDNAIKYTPAGGEVVIQNGLKEGQAYLRISDTGIGIAPEHLAHLGERFYRVDKARAREDGGAGLGLSLAQSILAVHNGSLTLTSTPQQGTTATITLPHERRI